MSTIAARPLRVYIAHPSELLTDHLSHGDGLVAFSFISRLAARGHEVHVAAQRVALRGDSVPPNLHIHQLAPRGDGTSARDRLLFMVRMRRLFRRLSRQLRFDIVHQMNPVFTGLSLSLFGVRTPLVLGTYVPRWSHGADGDAAPSPWHAGVWRALGNRIARFQQAQASGLLIASPLALSRISRPDRHQGRIYEVPHGIDLTQFVERAVIPSRPSVLFLAGVAHRKGIFTLLDAFEQVVKVMPDAELVIAGHDGGALDEVRRRVAAIAVGSIWILGAVDRSHVHDLMRAHSVYCLPSYGEPFATSILEAMACGVPVVTTNAGGIPDLVTDAGGRLVPPRDASALAAALLEVLGSPQLQRTMGAHNRMRVATVFNAERTVDRLEQVYRAVLEQEAAGAGRRGAPAAAPSHMLPPAEGPC